MQDGKYHIYIYYRPISQASSTFANLLTFANNLLNAFVILFIFVSTFYWRTYGKLYFIFHGQSSTNDQIVHANEFGRENQLRHFRSHYRNKRHKTF